MSLTVHVLLGIYFWGLLTFFITIPIEIIKGCTNEGLEGTGFLALICICWPIILLCVILDDFDIIDFRK